MRKFSIQCCVLLFLYVKLMPNVLADQYQSNELLEGKGMSSSTVKSIVELEADLNKLTDAYAKDSTAPSIKPLAITNNP